MKAWFLAGAIIAILLTACASEPEQKPTLPEPNETETPSEPSLNESVNETSPDQDQICCLALTAECLACSEGMTVDEYCLEHPETQGCPQTPTTILSDVSCEDEALSFRLTNIKDKELSFAPLSFPTPANKIQATMTINSYNAWSSREYFQESGLRDCMDGSLAPKESVRCTLDPIPIIPENDFSRNSILVQAVGVFEQENFKCS